jgi:hypothetical protein
MPPPGRLRLSYSNKTARAERGTNSLALTGVQENLE